MITIDIRATAENIRHLSKKKKISLSMMADKCGVGRNSVCNWRNGRGLPSIDHLVEIADMLDVTVDDLLITEKR